MLIYYYLNRGISNAGKPGQQKAKTRAARNLRRVYEHVVSHKIVSGSARKSSLMRIISSTHALSVGLKSVLLFFEG